MKLNPADCPTEQLLNQIARHVKHTELLSIALAVDMEEARLTQIQADFPLQAKNQIFRVHISVSELYRNILN